ncbi:alpha/beta hydrolase [Tianweitania sp. BSSL-BM11]|uniref:Alpha/beta hydrolase n=1 Tax=Tianweitania aestuarii TaxID=2814886 RepID=A0ABS5S0N2_9HYPH|nr:alpha/beta hydrolase-fold protein [Tianweitania aestuarii]MBS9721482.1 alpha/beta hydrolase [Tianweitania aestuarii]
MTFQALGGKISFLRSLTFSAVAVLSGLLVTPLEAEASEAKTFDYTSHGRSYRIWELAIGKAPAEGYPLVVLLDGNQMFPKAATIAQQDGRPRLLIGIGYPEDDRKTIVERRYFDLTPKTPENLLPLDQAGQPFAAGGLDEFTALLTNTILPSISKRHRINTEDSTLFGHSLSGLVALHVLFADLWSFTEYFAADPSVWWKNGAILSELEAFAETPQTRPKRLVITTSGRRREHEEASSAASTRMRSLRGGPTGKEVADHLAAKPSLTVTYKPMSNESHGSMVEPSLRWLLTRWSV